MTMLSGTSSKTRIAILMTCFNRRAVTLAGLASLQQQTGLDNCELAVYLVDDGSKDGTADAVQQQFPAVHLLRGDGSLFWNGGMRRAFSAAIATGYDSYLWFNDDTVLAPDAVHRLLATARKWEQDHGPAIVVGSVQDAVSGEHTYGGFIMQRHGLSMSLEAVAPDTHESIACDSMNGNFVLIPSAIVAVLGNLEARFRHQIGDVDYGLRARAVGFDVVLAPGYFGHCSTNSSKDTWRDGSIPFQQRWKNLMSPKGAPVSEWLLYTRRHYGWRWPLYFASPYVKTVLSGLMPGRSDSAAS
jgi:GT2 family glycosyltransferase